MNKLDDRCAKIAERFLLTALVVDDEAQIQDSRLPTPSPLQTPDRRTQAEASEEMSEMKETRLCTIIA